MDMNNKIDKNRLFSALKNAAGQNGLNAEKITSALNGGNREALLNSLNPEQAQKLNDLMNDPEAMQRILNSPQAAAIMKKLQKNK